MLAASVSLQQRWALKTSGPCSSLRDVKAGIPKVLEAVDVLDLGTGPGQPALLIVPWWNLFGCAGVALMPRSGLRTKHAASRSTLEALFTIHYSFPRAGPSSPTSVDAHTHTHSIAQIDLSGFARLTSTCAPRPKPCRRRVSMRRTCRQKWGGSQVRRPVFGA